MPDADPSIHDPRLRSGFSLSETTHLLLAIIDSLPAVISAKDRESRYLIMNKYQASLYDTTPEGAVGCTAGELLGEEYGAYTADKDRQVIESGQPSPSYEERYQDAFGIEHDWLTTKVPLHADNGNVYGVASISLDISDLKRTEARLVEQTVALEKANAELLAFTQAAAHDLREPIRQIVSHLQLLERRLGDGLPPDALEPINYVLDGAARLHSHFEGFLAYAQLDRQSGRMTPLVLTDIVGQALDTLSATVRAANGSVAVSVLPVVQGDRAQLTSLFDHLLFNAIKFRHPARPLQIQVFSRSDARGHEIVVRDNGIGIDPRYRKRIFAIFQRLYPREKYPGNGMGLAICDKIVDLHGGDIWCESVPGEGTDMVFTLPVLDT